MTVQDAGIDLKIVDAIKEMIEKEMGPFGLRHVKVSNAEDHDGDPIILIDAEYEAAQGRPIEPRVVAGLVTKLRDCLWKLGETRFPHIRHHFSEQQQVASR